jgi:hypothetical protein
MMYFAGPVNLIGREGDAHECLCQAMTGAARAADPPSAPVFGRPSPPPPDWSFRVIPYGWLTSLKESQMVCGRSADSDASSIGGAPSYVELLVCLQMYGGSTSVSPHGRRLRTRP